jgi:hypothetical protein
MTMEEFMGLDGPVHRRFRDLKAEAAARAASRAR